VFSIFIYAKFILKITNYKRSSLFFFRRITKSRWPTVFSFILGLFPLNGIFLYPRFVFSHNIVVSFIGFLNILISD
jgi:hypothetical protein